MKQLTWVLVTFALAGPVRADVIYSNLGPGESYRQTSGLGESGPSSGLGAGRIASHFTVGGLDASFDNARLALGLLVGTNEIDLRLYTDNGGRPGTVLETIHASGPMPPFRAYGSGHLVEFNSSLHPSLQAGGTYWLLPFASGDTYAGWNWSLGFSEQLAGSNEEEPTTWTLFRDPPGAFEVNGTPSPAPEPSCLMLAGVGALALLLCRVMCVGVGYSF
jgi:hypothetical protein